MMNQKQKKLENPIRLQELRPEETLRRIGLEDGHVICDIGAGSGVFTIAAAKITHNTVYALEISEDMLAIIQEKALAMGITNIRTVKVTGDSFTVENATVDIVLLAAILHEIPDKPVFLKNVKKLLKDSGKVAVIEFIQRVTPWGPPLAHRMGKDEISRELSDAGFTYLEGFVLGENFHCMIFSV